MKNTFFINATCLIIVLFTFSWTIGQKPLPHIVTGDDFLGKYVPPVVFDIELDSNDFVYMVCPGGLWKINGFSDESNWTLESQFDPTNYVAFHKGYNDQIILSGPFGIAQIKGDSLLKFPLPDSLIRFGARGYESVYTDKDGLLHIAPRYKGYFTVDSKGNATEIAGLSLGINGFVATHLANGKPFYYSITNANVKSPYSLYTSDIDSKLRHISEIDYPIHESSLVQYQNGSFMFSNGKHDLIHFDKNGLIKKHRFDHRVIKLFIDNKDNLWIGTVSNGFFKVDSLEFDDFENYLHGSAAVLAQGFDNGLWIKSNTQKFGYIPPSGETSYSDQNGYPMFSDITAVRGVEEQFIISIRNKKTLVLNGDKVTELPSPVDPNAHSKVFTEPNSFCYDSKMKNIWAAYFGIICSWNGNNWKVFNLDNSEFKSLKVFALKALKDGRIIGATQYEFFEITDGKISRISDHMNSKIQHFTVDELGRFWVGCYNGLWILEDGKFRRPFEKMPKELLSPSLFIAYVQDAIWYQPTVGGVYQIKEDSIIPVFDQSGKRVELYAHSISPNGDFWATPSTSGQVCRIETKNDTTYFQYYEFDNLATSNFDSRGFLATDKEILIGSRYGLFKQSIAKLTSKEIPSKVVATEIRINHEVVSLNDSYELSHNENYINITFDGISFRRIPLEYSYKMQGLDTVWRETKHRHVQFTNLPPGKYDFLLRVKPKNKEWSSPESIAFNIEKPYWQKWWFWLACLSSFLFISFFGIRLWIKNVRNKESEKGKIALELSRLELRALKAQMNPHFIFNTLKSIQNRILKDGKWEANDLLVRFSKLIRASLEYSRVDFIHLNEEIEFLSNYLEIEKQRIPDKFDFEVIIQQIEDMKDLLVPSLLIQPICENAINHAFQKGKGNLTLQLKVISEDLIEVVVADDGIGYYNINNFDDKSKHSRGLEIVHSRIELFKAQGYTTSIKIEPVNDISKKGTKVTLIMPCK